MDAFPPNASKKEQTWDARSPAGFAYSYGYDAVNQEIL
jgi:hypothetical protein